MGTGTSGKIRQSLYDILGVSSDASADEIGRAYKTLARKYHPDLNQGNPQAEMMFKAVARANDVLSDAGKRANYDDQLRKESDVGKPVVATRRPELSLLIFGVMLLLAMVFFFIDTPKGIYFLVVAVALEIRNSIESLRSDLKVKQGGR